MNSDEAKNGVLPFEFQCKTIAKSVNYHKVLGEMPGDEIRCILHRYTQKSAKGKFIEKGRYAILPMEDLIKILEKLYKQN